MSSSNRSNSIQNTYDPLDRISDPIIALDEDHRYTYVNQGAAQFFHLDPESLLGEDIWDAFPGPWEAKTQNALRRAIERDQEASFERYNRRVERWFEYKVDSDGTGATIRFSDITERKEREIEPNRAETLFQNTQDGLFVVDVEDDGDTFRLNRINQSYAELTNASIDEFQGKTVREITSEADSEAIREKYRKCVNERTELTYEERVSIFGDNAWWETKIAPVVVDDTVTQLVGSTRKITERKQRENQLRKFEQMVQHTGHAVFFTNADGEIQYVNPAFERITGYTEAEVTGRTPDVLNSGEHADAYFADLWETVLDGEVWNGEIVNERKDGTRFVAKHTIAPVTDESGEATNFVAIYDDITERKEREDELRRKRRALEKAPVGISISDPSQEDNPMTYVNEAFTDITGYDEDEAIGRNCRFLQGEGTDPDQVEKIRHAIDEVCPIDITLRDYRKDGTAFWNQLSIAPVRDEDGSLESFVGFQKDITERKEREKRLQTHERVVQAMNEVAFLVDDKKRIRFANDAALDFADILREAIEGQPIEPVTEEMAAPDEDPRRFLDALDAVLNDGEPDVGKWIREPDGSETLSLDFDLSLPSAGDICVEQRFVPVELYDGQRGVAVISRDVTERKENERTIKTHLEQAQNIGTTGSWHLVFDDDTLYWSDECYRIFGIQQNQPMTYDRFMDAVHPEDRESVDEAWNASLEGETYDFEHRIVVDGKVKWVRETAEITFDDDGEPMEAIGVVKDITEQKEREQQIDATRKRYQTLLQGAPDPVFVVDANTGDVIETNSAAESLRGQDAETIKSLHMSDIHPPDEREKVQALFPKAVDNGGKYREYPDGTQIHAVTAGEDVAPVEITVSTFELPDRSVTYGIFRDITEQKEREREIIEQKQRYEALFNSIRDPIVVTDTDGRITNCNPGFIELFGYELVEIEGQPVNTLLAGDSDVSTLLNIGDNAIGDTNTRTTRRFRKRCDQRFPGEVSLSQFTDAEGNVVGHVYQIRDVSDREKNRQQMKVIDRVLRHNIRNDMTAVIGHAELIKANASSETQPSVEKILEISQNFVETAEKQRRITRILTDPPTRTTFDIVPIVEAAAAEVQEKYPGADVNVSLPESVRVGAIPDINEAVRELLRNAIIHSDKATPTAEIDVRNSDGTTTLSIRDDGPGIPEMESNILTQQAEIDPLYHGSGLGLWLVHEIVRRSDGQLAFEGTDSEGSTVTIYLPTE